MASSGYQGKDAALADHLKHTPIVQGDGPNAAAFFPIVHTIFSNTKAWLVDHMTFWLSYT